MKRGQPQVKKCKQCGTEQHSRRKKCVRCGFVFYDSEAVQQPDKPAINRSNTEKTGYPPGSIVRLDSDEKEEIFPLHDNPFIVEED